MLKIYTSSVVLIPRLKVTAEINESVEDVSDRMEVVESLIQVLSAALCCCIFSYVLRHKLFECFSPTSLLFTAL